MTPTVGASALDEPDRTDRPSLDPAQSRPVRRGAFSSLRDNPQFRLLWLSNLFFFGGAWTQTLVLGWLVFDITGSELLVAVFTAARLAPMLLGPFAGALADRFDRVRLLIIACAWALFAVSAVATLTTMNMAPYWVLLVGGLAIGLAQSPSQPARSSLVMDLVGREHLSNANALNSMAMNMTQVVGPAAGGVLISAFGVSTALWISTAWYGISLVMVLPLRGSTRVAQAHAESAVRMVVSGFRTIARNRLAATVLLITLAANICLWPVYQAFMPVFASESLGLDAAGLGALLTCSGVGGLIGSLIIAFMGDFRFKGALFVVGTAGWAALWSVFALSRSIGVSFVLMAAIGLLSAAFNVLQTTLVLMTTDPGMQGRALGLQELAIGIMPVAALVLGVAAEQVGVAATTFASALVLVGLTIALAAWTPQLLRYSGVQGAASTSLQRGSPPQQSFGR